MDMPEYALHPQSLLMETTWVCAWFTRLLKKLSDIKSGSFSAGITTEQVFIADRSPFSACFYSQRGGKLLDPVIREQIRELRAAVGIEVYTVYVKVDKTILWERIQDRLEVEPERKKYNEDKREWMEKTVDFYDSQTWDVVVENNDITMPHLLKTILSNLSNRSQQLRAILSHEDSPGRSYFRKQLGTSDITNLFASDSKRSSDDAEDSVRPGVNARIMSTPSGKGSSNVEVDSREPSP